MGLLTYSLTALIAFSGLFVGKALAFFSPEEMASGKKYFLLMHKIILVLVVVLLINSFGLTPIYRIIAYVIVIAALFLSKKPKSDAIYALLGLCFFLSSKTNYFLAISSLIFLYGFPIGSLVSKKYNFLKLLACHVLFLIIALALFFIS